MIVALGTRAQSLAIVALQTLAYTGTAARNVEAMD